jgi:putative membrane protein insertion efficiency factor
MLERLAQLPKFAVLGALRLYQRLVSPVLPAFLGPNCGCRFTPSCSHYARAAVETHGVIAGTGLALWRLAKCHPLHPGGFDPVPPAKPRCARVRA